MKRGYQLALIALSLLTVISLVLNGVMILALSELRQTAWRVVADTRELVTQFTDDTLSYTVEVDQDIPVSTEIPLSESIAVPINAAVPISTTVVVPVDLGLATYRLTVPIETVFPVDMEITVPVSQVVDITTVVPLEVDVPIEIAVEETPLVGYLRDVDATLKQAEERLERSIWHGSD